MTLPELRKLAEAATPGARFGRWTVIERAHKNSAREWLWHCRCDCGTLRAVKASALRSGTSKSCGCLHREIVTKASTTHGGRADPEYTIWSGIISRCEIPSSTHFQHD